MPDPYSTKIPRDEQERFTKHLYFYPFDATIIQEGQDDNAVYLLREGTVAIEKTLGNKTTKISSIEAVNFFGEMALIARGKRTATVRVISPQAIVYKFLFLDLKVIYANPAWSELLIARLCNDLIETNNRASTLDKEILQLSQNKTNSSEQTGLLFSALLFLQKESAADVVVNTKAWVLLKGMRELIENYLQIHLPEVYARLNQNNRAAVQKLSEESTFPEILKPLM